MNTKNSAEFGVIASSELAQLAREYALRLVPFDSQEVLLVGRGYVLDFAGDREGIELSYVEFDERGQLAAYTMRPLDHAAVSVRGPSGIWVTNHCPRSLGCKFPSVCKRPAESMSGCSERRPILAQEK